MEFSRENFVGKVLNLANKTGWKVYSRSPFHIALCGTGWPPTELYHLIAEGERGFGRNDKPRSIHEDGVLRYEHGESHIEIRESEDGSPHWFAWVAIM